MIQLYLEIFAAKNFDVREIIAARRSDDGLAMQQYVGKMVDFRKYHNIYKTRAVFLDLKGKIIQEMRVPP